MQDELKSTKEEFRKMQLQNKKLEKMLDKPVRDQAEDDSGQVERVKVLMNDLRLLQVRHCCLSYCCLCLCDLSCSCLSHRCCSLLTATGS